jgi:hypothetical protein
LSRDERVLEKGYYPFSAVCGDIMKPNKICPALVVLALSLIVLLGIPAVTADEAAPQLPQGFYGIVEAGSSPVGPGLIVEAVGPGVSSKMEGNPVTTLADGSYGVLNYSSQKLIVQGDIATGTPLTFYVGAIQAEVYDVAAGGPWHTTYSFQPGEITELNLRIASMPAAGQTRVPTPVQTIVVSSNVAASSTAAASSSSAGSSTTSSGDSALPQVPDTSGQQPIAEGTQQYSGGAASAAQSGTGQEVSAQGASQQSGGQENQTAPPVPLPAPGNMTLYIVGGILLLLVIGGGAYYYTQQKKSDTESNEETGKKEE